MGDKITPTSSRILSPTILQTKEELRMALKNGTIKSTKYNLLDDQYKLFVELVCFGGYTGEQAVRAMSPGIRNPLAAANKILSDVNVQATIEELTVSKDKKFQAEVSSARDIALEKLKFIMMTTDDNALAASCAKIILDKAESALKNSTNKDEPVGQVKFNIQVENLYNGEPSLKKDEPVIIEVSDEEIDPAIKEVAAHKERLVAESKKIDAEIAAKIGENPPDVNPETGLNFTLNYEGMDNYGE